MRAGDQLRDRGERPETLTLVFESVGQDQDPNVLAQLAKAMSLLSNAGAVPKTIEAQVVDVTEKK